MTTGNGRKYKAPMAVVSHYGMTRKEWMKLTKGAKCSLIRKYDWETDREKMLDAKKKGIESQKKSRMILEGMK